MTTKHEAIIFLNHTITPALQSLPALGRIPLCSAAAGELLLGTAIVESDLLHRKQLGDGPARSLFQMEPLTHDDIWNNYLKYHPELGKAIASLMKSPDKLLALEHENQQYACAMARAHYARVKWHLPEAGDVEAMAKYWKKHYNTEPDKSGKGGGKGTTEKYIEKWNKVMGGKW